MDWRVMLTTFGVIFLAEIGDKTQIAAMTMAAEKKRPWAVFIGASLALVAVSASMDDPQDPAASHQLARFLGASQPFPQYLDMLERETKTAARAS